RELARAQEAYGALRRSQVGRGERAEKIRTYNFRENRVTDHRIGLTLYNLQTMLDGDLDPMIDALAIAAEKELALALSRPGWSSPAWKRSSCSATAPAGVEPS